MAPVDPPADGGPAALSLLISLQGGTFDLDRARREFLGPGTCATPLDLLRIAKAEGLKARLTRSSTGRLDALTLPVIGRARDGGFFVIGRRTGQGLLVGQGGGGPVEWTRAGRDPGGSHAGVGRDRFRRLLGLTPGARPLPASRHL